MNSERARLNTFHSWPTNAEVDPQRIAKAGFYYTGVGTAVVCFCCGSYIREWNYGDQVMAKHRRINPECLFVKNPINSGNIPIANRSFQTRLPATDVNVGASTSVGDIQQVSDTSLPDRATRQTENLHASNRNIVEERNVPGTSTSTQNSRGLNLNHPANLYKSEAARLRTFTSWPKGHIVTAEQLARTGFYYLRDGDKVQCAFCFGMIDNWELGDNPEIEHQRHFPSCPLHYNMAVGNIPLTDSGSSSQEEGRDNIVLREVRPFSGPDKEHIGNVNDRPGAEMHDLGIHSHRGPKYPKYSTVESRLRTFSNWPTGLSQTPQQLAQAGFYYTGVNDQVRCFHCDGGLRQWDEQDDPWVEHARWFSKCTYVVLVKGEEFIQRCIAEYPPLLSTNDIERNRTQPSSEQRSFRVRQITEEELEGLMDTEPARMALDIGLDPNKIKQALRWKMEQTGLPFTTSDALIEVVLDISSDTNTPESSALDSTQLAASGSREAPEVRQQSNETSDHHVPLTFSKSMPVLPQEHVEVKLEPDSAQSLPDLPEKTQKQKLQEGDNSLEEENRRLKEARLCKICMDEEVGVVFVPCGHLVTCVNCTSSIQDCPMCRQPIKATVRTFLS